MNVEELVADLDRRLAARCDPAKKDWWQRYLKGAIGFYGVGIPDVRAVVADWLRDHALGEVDGDALMALASRSVALPVAEDKLAAMLLLQEHGLDRIEPERHLSQIAQWFDRGDVADWNTCDWLCVRVLGPLIAAHGEPVARQVAEWVHAPGLWRRRAAGVAFVNLAPDGEGNFEGFAALVLRVMSRTVADRERFAQTGTGWVLRELSKAEPRAVRAFVAAQLHEFAREAIKMATAKLPEEDRRPLLRAHNGNANVSGRHAGR